MRQMPSYSKAMQAIVHYEVQQEVEGAARRFEDPPLKEFTRADLVAFNTSELYEKQLTEAPILMSALVAASTTQKFCDIKVREFIRSSIRERATLRCCAWLS